MRFTRQGQLIHTGMGSDRDRGCFKVGSLGGRGGRERLVCLFQVCFCFFLLLFYLSMLMGTHVNT
jgi:hypothetical protein